METSDLFLAHHLALFRWLRRVTGRDDVAEDLLQETFLRALRGAGAPPGSEKAWLFTVARNLLLNRRRDEARRPREVVPTEAATASADPPPERALDLAAALGTLPAVEREAFLLREVGGLAYAEIAGVTGGTPDAVRNRIFRARQALRAALAAHAVPAQEG